MTAPDPQMTPDTSHDPRPGFVTGPSGAGRTTAMRVLEAVG